MSVPHKYGLLRTISFVLKLLAWLALIVGVLAAVVAIFSLGRGNSGLVQILRSVGIIVGPVIGIIWFVQLFAFGSVLSLLVDIEENTRLLAAEPTPYALPGEPT